MPDKLRRRGAAAHPAVPGAPARVYPEQIYLEVYRLLYPQEPGDSGDDGVGDDGPGDDGPGLDFGDL